MTQSVAESRAGGNSGLARSGLMMATGTLASRITGFLRTVVIAAALGRFLGDAYNVANTIPNILYDLLLGGVLSSIVIPLLVQAAQRGEEEGTAYAQRLFTIVAASLTVVAVAGVLLAPEIVALYAGRLTPANHELATTFARYFLPQVLFYGVGAVLGAILNTRGSFAAPMWAPVLNNLVVIASGALFLAITGSAPRPGSLTHGQMLVLAIGTTAGIVVQTIALVPALRHVQFRLRLRWDWRGAGFRSAGPFAAWMVGYVLTNQLGFLVIVNLATASGRARGTSGFGYSAYTYAFVLFSLPYAVIAVSVVTALFPRMSRSAALEHRGEVANTLAGGLTLSATLLVPATAALIALGPLIGAVVFAHGNTDLSDARLTGATLAAFAVGLVPFSAFQIQLRAWLAMNDSRTPALVNVAITAVNVLADVVLYLALPAREKVVGLALGFSLSYIVGTLWFSRALRARLGPANEHRVARTYVRLAVASVVAVVPAYVASRLLTARLGLDPESSLVAIAVALVVGGGIFAGIARRMRIRELAELTTMLRSRLGGNRPSAG
jgi:putative peptidoglycan lipid II flippase